jgi:hypothetical protein
VNCKPRAVFRLPAVNLAKVGDSCLVNSVIFTAEYAEEMFEIGNREWGMGNNEKCISAIVQGVHSCTRVLHCCTSYFFHLPYSLFSLPD